MTDQDLAEIADRVSRGISTAQDAVALCRVAVEHKPKDKPKDEADVEPKDEAPKAEAPKAKKSK